MQTIKTAVVVVLLMVILYGAFVAMNGQETELPPDLENMIAMGPDFAIEAPTASPSDNMEPAALAKPEDATSTTAPFAMWPGSSTSNASTPATPEPPKAELASTEGAATPSLLLPPSTTTSTDTTKASVPATATTEQTTAPSSDPWLKTLQNSVAGADSKPAASEAPKPLDPAPTTLASTTSNASPTITVPDVKKPAESAVNASLSDSDTTGEFSVTSLSFENAKKQALEQIEKSKLKEGLQTLSLFYNSPELTAEQRSDLLDMLDALAFEVIYSRRHLLDLPYIVAPGETLEQIAQMHEIPVELLAKVNGTTEIDKLAPGTKLKVMKGPFRVEVNVAQKEMTLFLGELYAGRFPVSTGSDPAPKEGVFQVVEKQRDRNYYGAGGVQIDGTDPRNPYGGFWLDLGQQLSIHGSPENPTPDTEKLGCISLSPIDAADVFTMLSRGSQVTIKR